MAGGKRTIRGFFQSFASRRRGQPAASAPAPAPAPTVSPLDLPPDNTPGGVMRMARTQRGFGECLRGGTLLAYLRACLDWAIYETHSMLFVWMCPPAFDRQEYDVKVRSPFVRFNPFYWFSFVCTIPFLLVGMIFHDLLGQGPADFIDTTIDNDALSPHRAEVQEAENHIRIHWLYITDGFYALELCVGIADLCALVYEGLHGWSAELTEILGNDVVLPLCMIFGNVFFLAAIHKKRHWSTRYFILVNCAYASAKVVEFVLGLTVIFRLGSPRQYSLLIMSYCVETAMFVLAVYIYSKLWFAYEDIVHEALESARASEAEEPPQGGAVGAGAQNPKPVLHHVHRAIDGIADKAERTQAGATKVSLPCCGRAQEWPVFTLVLLVLTCLAIWAAMVATLMLRAGWFSDVTRTPLGEVGHELKP